MVEALTAAFAELEDRGGEPWYCEPRDKDPRSEFARQRAFLAYMGRNAPAVIVYAVPNAGRSSDWERLRRHAEGATRGALDLEIKWQRRHPYEHDCFVAEFKNGTTMPTPAQRDMLNRLHRAGHLCGVYRTAGMLVEHLRAAGCPFL